MSLWVPSPLWFLLSYKGLHDSKIYVIIFWLLDIVIFYLVAFLCGLEVNSLVDHISVLICTLSICTNSPPSTWKS